MRLTLAEDAFVEDCGTVVILQGRDEQDRMVTFGCDQRPAQDLADAIEAGIVPEVEVEGFAIMHVGKPGADV